MRGQRPSPLDDGATVKTERLLNRILDGIVKDVSIGFYLDYRSQHLKFHSAACANVEFPLSTYINNGVSTWNVKY